MSDVSKLVDLDIDKVAGVDKAANQRKFLVVKRADEEDEKLDLEELQSNLEKAGRTLNKDNLESLMEIHDNIMDMLMEAGIDPYSIMDEEYKYMAKGEKEDMDRMKKGDFMKMDEEDMYKEYDKMCKMYEKKEKEMKKMEEEMKKAEGVEKSKKSVDELIKMENLPEEVRSQLKKQKEMESKLEKMEQERIEKKYQEEVSQFDNLAAEKDELKEVLKFVGEQDEGLHDKLTGVLKSADEAIEKGDLFKEKGKTGAETSSNAIAKMDSKASEIAKSQGISKEKAFVKAMKQNPDLYDEYQKEMNQ